MQTHPPYHITHFKLDHGLSFPSLEQENVGHYVVFWWKDIALGDFFVAPNAMLTKQEFLDKMVGVLLPALRFYTNENSGLIQQWRQLLQNHGDGKWAALLERIFAATTAPEIPAAVPVSVVICTRNRANDLRNCLEQLGKSACLPEEILVVDNAPTDDSTYQVTLLYPNVTYIKESRPGLDIARNTGALNASCDVIAYCDDDVLTHPLWIYRVWQTFRDTNASAMTGLVIAAELETEAQLIFEKHWSFNRGYVDNTYDNRYFTDGLAMGPPVWRIGAGANMAFRKSVFEEVGYFDELLDVGAAGCSGDSEMWYRILLQGHTIVYNPRAVTFHRHRQEIKALQRQLFSYMRGFAAAALIQQDQHQQAAYRRRLFVHMPKHYAKLLYSGFPKYEFRFQTLSSEIRGFVSGIVYYVRNRKQPINLKTRTLRNETA